MAPVSKTILKRKANEIRSLAVSFFQLQRQELLKAIDSPLGLATAFALGTLTSFFPVPVLDSLLAVVLAAKFARLNKTAIFMARVVWNDLLVIPLYAPGLKVGQWVLTAVLSTETGFAVFHPHFLLLLSFILGGVLLAVSAATFSFVIISMVAIVYHSKTVKVILGFRLPYKKATPNSGGLLI